MKVNDIVLWEDRKFGIHRFWRIESVLLGGVKQESLVRIVSMSHSAGSDEYGNLQTSVLVPEVLIRDRIYTPSVL